MGPQPSKSFHFCYNTATKRYRCNVHKHTTKILWQISGSMGLLTRYSMVWGGGYGIFRHSGECWPRQRRALRQTNSHTHTHRCQSKTNKAGQGRTQSKKQSRVKMNWHKFNGKNSRQLPGPFFMSRPDLSLDTGPSKEKKTNKEQKNSTISCLFTSDPNSSLLRLPAMSSS